MVSTEGIQRWAIILEALLGGDLHDFKYQRRIPRSEVVLAGLFDQLLAGLEYCHRVGVVHRDIKVGFFEEFFEGLDVVLSRVSRVLSTRHREYYQQG